MLNQRIRVNMKDFRYNWKRTIAYQIFYPLNDRIRYLFHGEKVPLRLQMVRQTVTAKSRRLKARWIVEDL